MTQLQDSDFLTNRRFESSRTKAIAAFERLRQSESEIEKENEIHIH